MNQFDLLIISFLNGFAHTVRPFDRLLVLISGSHLLKGGVFVAVFWWFWFRRDKRNHIARERVIATILAGFVALFVARSLAVSLPFRPRPLHNPTFDFQLPYGMVPRAMESWSAFPSDHGALFFAFAAGIFMISKAVGGLAFAYALFMIVLPRIYLGLHYPTDVLAGALIGIGIAWFANTERVRRRIVLPAMQWLYKAPCFFYACFFLLTYEIASMFDNVRAIGRFGLWVLRALLA
jgi:undecaprenyl-diphosphatase